MRQLAWDHVQLYADLDSATQLVFLPAWLVVLGAAVTKRRFLLIAGGLLVLAQLIYVTPELAASSALPASVHSEKTFRLFDANVYERNTSMVGYISQLRNYKPDLLTMEEATPDDRDQLALAGVLTHIPHMYEISCCGSRGLLVASRYPISSEKVYYVKHLAYLFTSTLHLPSGPVSLWVVHTTAPVGKGWNLWNEELHGVLNQLQALRPRSLLLIGDFNATWGNQGFRAILSTGLTDAAAARGDPFEFTWSQQMSPLPPLLRIDHVLTKGSLAVTRISTQRGPGSDHRDMTATIATG